MNNADYDELANKSFEKYNVSLSDEQFEKIEEALSQDQALADEYFNVMGHMALWIFHLGNFQQDSTLLNESYCNALAEKIQKNWGNWHTITQQMCHDFLKANKVSLDEIFKIKVPDVKEAQDNQEQAIDDGWIEYLNNLPAKEASELGQYYDSNKDFRKEIQQMYSLITETMLFSILQNESTVAKKQFHETYDSFLRQWKMSDKATRNMAVFYITNSLIEEGLVHYTSLDADIVYQNLDNLKDRIVKDLGNVLNLPPKLKLV